MKSGWLYQALSWVITLLTPLALVLTAVRLLLTPVTVYVEYNTPGFPPDPFGFTKEDRLYWSQIGMNYLLNDAGVNYVGDLRFADGKPVYNERELRHYEDAKRVLKQALALWIGALAALIALGIWGWLGGWWELFRRGLRRGAWLTLILIALVLVLVLVAFQGFFVAFHEALFPAGTWTFEWSDTFIRLFPERFWRDVFVYVGVLTLIPAVVLVLLLRKRKSD